MTFDSTGFPNDVAGVNEACFGLTFFDVAEDAVAGFGVDHGTDGAAGILGGSDGEAAGGLDQAIQESIV